MEKEISFDLINSFSEDFNNTKDSNLQSQLQNRPLLEVCLDEEVKKENKFEFNVELEDTKIYHQKKTKRCWLFATINFIKNDIAHNLGQSPLELELSVNYLNFFDKLEKANHAYQTIIDLDCELDDFKPCDYETHPILTGYLRSPVRENGKVVFAQELLKKYGIMPAEFMPETYNSMDSEDFNNLFTRKIRYDMLELISLKKNNGDVYLAKERMLRGCYNMLSLILGEPPKSFTYFYTNQEGEEVKLENLTPQEFYSTFCKINFDDYIQLGNYDIFEYYKKYERRYTQNIVEGKKMSFVNVPQEELSKLCIKQLEAGIPVIIGTENRKYRDSESKVLDTRNFKFEEFFDYKDLSKEQSLETFDTHSRHVMVLRGVHIEENNPVRWKVEDSYGDDARINGYYVMNDNYFKKCVFFALINKKFVSSEILKASQQPAESYCFEGGEI